MSQPVEILLVEDNEDDILILKEALGGAKLLNLSGVLRDGEQAMAYLHGEATHNGAKLPGLILLDINMPKKNGFEVLEEIKADPQLRHIPVVMMTVSERDEDVLRSYSEGACSYIKKPLEFTKLREVIRVLELYWTVVSSIPHL